jgi:hypothetical protein
MNVEFSKKATTLPTNPHINSPRQYLRVVDSMDKSDHDLIRYFNDNNYEFISR